MCFKREVVSYISYRKLFAMLYGLGRIPTSLYEVVSPPTLAKLRKNEPVSMDVIVRLCEHLGVQPGDIMEVRRKTKCVEVTENE